MIRNYLLVAWKVLLRRKFFTFISLFGICFTLMVLMMAIALIDHTFAPHEPETRLDRMLGIYTVTLKSPSRNSITVSSPGYGFLNRYARTLPGIQDFSICTATSSFSMFVRGRELTLDLKQTDGAYWRILDFTFLEGRPFTVEEDNGGIPVAVISDAVRRQLFGKESALGRTITAEGKLCRIIGVVTSVPILRAAAYADVWVPVGAFREGPDTELTGRYRALILAKSASDFPRIKAEYQARLRQVEFPDPTEYNLIISATETFAEQIAGEIVPNLFGIEDAKYPVNILLWFGGLAAFLFMLLPAVNLVNINISRIMERSSEIGVRKSFGASSRALVGQFIVENLVLVSIGGALGLLMSWLMLRWIAALELIPHAEFQLNYRIFLYAFFITVFFGVFSGVYPAWRMSRLHPIAALKGGVRS